MDGIFNTEEGIALIKQENEINKKLNIAQWKFIEEHPESIVGNDLALQFLQGMYVNLTVPQLEQLTTLITKAWANIPPMAENFKTIADKAKTMAIGEDLGDMTDDLRRNMEIFGILSYRVLPFERKSDMYRSMRHPGEYPQMSVCAPSTHDTPTLVSQWNVQHVWQQ